MAIVETDVEQIWQTIEALSSKDREIIKERLGRAKPSKGSLTTSPSTPIDDEIFTLSFEKYLALSDDERDSIHLSAYAKYRNWIDEELERRKAEWILVVGGDIIEAGETLDDYPSRDKLYKLGYHYGLIPFVFVANPIIEESLWAALPKGDFYPTMSITISSDSLQSLQNDLTLQADFDTGSFNILLDYDDLLQKQIIDRQPVDQANEGLHLSKKYKFHIMPIGVGMLDETGKTLSTNLSVFCVRNWQESPLCLVNPSRRALVGRKILLHLPVRVELNGRDRLTKIFAVS